MDNVPIEPPGASEIQQAEDEQNRIVIRYREHLRVLDEGPATAEQFSKSPYFRSDSKSSTLHTAWYWDEHLMHVDQATLARAFVEQPDWKAKYYAAMIQHGFTEKAL